MTDREGLKRAAANRALEQVRSGMTVGLGTGSTARFVTEGLGARLAAGDLVGIRGVPTSEATARLATEVGIPLIALPSTGVDIAIDGMDEVTPDLDAIKGLGGALTREKIVAASAATFILIGDDSKRVTRLGEKAPIPVEVLPFGWLRTRRLIAELGCDATLRGSEQDPFITDNGNFILHCRPAAGFDPRTLAEGLSRVPGVVEHGLFLGLADLALVADDARVEELKRTTP